jgi:hypothetical protein
MATTNRDLQRETLTLIRSLYSILESQSSILASPEDCDYFRAVYRNLKDVKKETPSPPPPPPVILQAPEPPTVQTPPKPALLPPEPKPVMEPPPRMPELKFEDIRKILSAAIPELVMMPDIPSDAMAKKMAERWKTKNQSAPISVISFHETGPQHQFLLNLTQAIDVAIGQAKLISAEGIEKDNQWEAFLSVPELKLIIIGDYALWQLPHLLQFYREMPNRSERMLKDTQVMLLPDLTLYLKDPLLKRSLWKALCQKIGSL